MKRTKDQTYKGPVPNPKVEPLTEKSTMTEPQEEFIEEKSVPSEPELPHEPGSEEFFTAKGKPEEKVEQKAEEEAS